jgi:hypothetical protein
MKQEELTGDAFLWALQGICALHRKPFPNALARQQLAAPYTTQSLPGAMQVDGFEVVHHKARNLTRPERSFPLKPEPPKACRPVDQELAERLGQTKSTYTNKDEAETVIKHSQIRLRSAFFLLVTLAGCSETPSPDPYYLQIKDVQFAVPKSYVESGVSMETAGAREEIRGQAAKPPGYKTNSFHTWLNASDTTPWDKHKTPSGIPDQMEVVVADSVPALGPMPDVKAARLTASATRLSSRDEYGLTAYQEGAAQPSETLTYVTRLDDASIMVLSCGGFGLPNPMCRATTSWHGLLLKFNFRYIYLPQWRAVHKRVVDRLNTFTSAQSKVQK